MPAALEQAVVSGVLDQRMLETIGRLRGDALDKNEVRLVKPLERGLTLGLIDNPQGTFRCQLTRARESGVKRSLNNRRESRACQGRNSARSSADSERQRRSGCGKWQR